MAKRESSPGISPAKKRIRYRSGSNFNAEYTVSHLSYAPLFKGPHFSQKMMESNFLYDNLLIDILSV